MIDQKKVVVVLPAYNAERTLSKTYQELPFHIVDEVVLVDDASSDRTAEVARELGIQHIVVHKKNLGYGGNQKSCYRKALALGADIIIMVHPDYQYTPKLVGSMCSMISNNVYPVVYASRILGKGATKGGMPLYKYFFNRVLTLFQNLLMNQKLSEYHTGYRAFSKEIFDAIDIERNSDNFVFDNQITAQIFHAGFDIGELSCPTRYFEEASSINLRNSIRYGWGVLWVSIQYRLQRWKMASFSIFKLKN